MPELNGPVYASFLILGAANLVPWMTFLSLADYFSFRYGNNEMEFTFPAISTSVLVAVSALLLAVGSAFSFDVRIVPPTLAMALMMLTVPAIDVLVVSGSLTTEVAFPLTLLTVFVSALSSAVAQNSLYGLGGLLGEGVMQALQAGNGVAGVLSVALRAASKLGLPVALSMWVFCGAAALLVVLSVFGYRRVMVDPQIASAVYAARNSAGQFARNSPTRILRRAPLHPILAQVRARAQARRPPRLVQEPVGIGAAPRGQRHDVGLDADAAESGRHRPDGVAGRRVWDVGEAELGVAGRAGERVGLRRVPRVPVVLPGPHHLAALALVGAVGVERGSSSHAQFSRSHLTQFSPFTGGTWATGSRCCSSPRTTPAISSASGCRRRGCP